MRFQLDEMLSSEIAKLGRRLGLDIISSSESRRDGLADEEQLGLAAADDRCFVTVNRTHFIDLTNVFFAEQRPHAGVLIVSSSWPTNDFSRIARALVAYAERHGDGPTTYMLDFLR